jgi:hypothetical protein
MAFKPLTRAINSQLPLTGAPPPPYKRRAPPPEFTAPLPASLHFSPCSSLPLTERRHLTVLPHRRPASTALPELRLDPSQVPLAPLSVLRPRRRALAHRSRRRPSSGEHAAVPSVRAGVGPRWTEDTRPVHGDVDPVHGINRWKIIHHSDYSEILQRGPWTFVKSTRDPDFANFALRPLGFSEINPRSTIFAVRSEI